MEPILNKKLWLIAAPFILLMAGCLHSDDNNTTTVDDTSGGGGDGGGSGGGGGGGGGSTPTGAGPAIVNLGTAGNFVILAKQHIAANNPVLTGDIGVISGVSSVPPVDNGVSGFLEEMDTSNTFSTSSMVSGKIYASDYAAPTPTNLITAETDMIAAYNDAAGRTASVIDLGNGEIGGMTLAPGLYKSSGPIKILSNVTLSGGPNDVWIFQVTGDLNQAPATSIVLQGGAQAKNVFWQVIGDSLEDTDVYIGETAHFEGNILARTQISLGTKATMKGRLLSQHVVTLDENTVTHPAL